MDHLDQLAPGGVGGRGPMDGPWGNAGGSGPLGAPQRRGPPPGPVEDHFGELGIGVGPGGPMGMPPQPRGGFPPNPSGFSGAMNNVGNAGGNQGLLQRLINSQQQQNNHQFNPVSAPSNSL